MKAGANSLRLPGSDLQEKNKIGPLVFLDADNTLWDTNNVFADAQLQLLRVVEIAIGIRSMATDRLGFIREVDQAIAQAHHHGLKYPPRLLVIALAHALAGVIPERAASIAWSEGNTGIRISNEEINQISQQYLETLARVPELRSGVRFGLLALNRSGARIVVLTEGQKDRAVANLKAHDLLAQVEQVIEATKTPTLFKRLVKLANRDQLVVMIGDQISSDIAPAAAVGVRTIHIPADFKPHWERTHPGGLADYELSGFEEVPTAVAELLKRPTS